MNAAIIPLDKLKMLMGPYIGGGRTGTWLYRHHGIYGFIDSIDGIYKEATERIL